MHGRVTLCLIAAALGILVAGPAVLAATPTTPTPTPSSGGGSSGINCAPLATQCTVSAGSPGSSGGSGSGGGTTTVTCSWQGPLSTITIGDSLLPFVVYGSQTSSSETGDYYVATCTPVLDDEVGEWLALVWPAAPTRPTPGQVGQTAEADLNLPAPTVSTAPSGGKAIV